MPKPLDTDLSQQTIIVTGANAGIGRMAAEELARLGAQVVMGCRSEAKGQAARDAIVAATGNERVSLELVDLSSQRSIEAFAARFREQHERLDVLLNNAGVWLTEKQQSVDGIEMMFATNVLGYFHLTNQLLDLLKASAPARIVNVASQMARNMDPDDLLFERRKYSGTDAYAQSKQANRMWSWSLAEKLEGTGVTVNALHPGVVRTNIAGNAKGILGVLARGYFKITGRTPGQGADTAVWLAASPELAGVTGKFWVDRKEKRCRYRDPAARARLWEQCEALITAPA